LCCWNKSRSRRVGIPLHSHILIHFYILDPILHLERAKPLLIVAKTCSFGTQFLSILCVQPEHIDFTYVGTTCSPRTYSLSLTCVVLKTWFIFTKCSVRTLNLTVSHVNLETRFNYTMYSPWTKFNNTMCSPWMHSWSTPWVHLIHTVYPCCIFNLTTLVNPYHVLTFNTLLSVPYVHKQTRLYSVPGVHSEPTAYLYHVSHLNTLFIHTMCSPCTHNLAMLCVYLEHG